MKIKCPIPECGSENSFEALRCQRCGANLQAYNRLLLLPDYLFNRGLSFAQQGDMRQAEGALQAALTFNPKDTETLLLLAEVQSAAASPAAAQTLTRADQAIGESTPWKDHLDALKMVIKEVQTPTLSAASTAQMKAKAQKIAHKHKKRKG